MRSFLRVDFDALGERAEVRSSMMHAFELAQRHIKTERRSLAETAQLLGLSGLPTFPLVSTAARQRGAKPRRGTITGAELTR